DIDEYWVSSNFQHSIQDFLRSMPDFDSCLFPWLLDVPDHQRSPDDFPFQALGHYQKSSHVKSLLNLKAAVRQVGIHKHIIGETQGRQARHLLPDGNFVGQRPEDGGKEPSLLGAGRMRVDAAFICHQLYRSQAEYLARLLNGRQAVGGREWLKSNRYGYVPKWDGNFVLDWSVDASRLADYRRGYDALRSTLASELAVARQFVLARKDELLAGLRHDGFLQSVYSAALKGVDETTLPRQLPPFAMQAQIQAMGFDEERACCWFTFAIVTREPDYELFLTEGYSRTRLEASIRALDAGEEETAQPRRFRAEVDVHALMHLYNPRQPPFCLVACAGENWVLLAQQGFAALAPAAFQRVRALKLARSSSGDTVSKRGLPVSKRLGSGWPVWKKRMMAWVK
ncbi:MAG: hypothetical protein KDI15_14075, partial [Thiothrix sp.]|nr:hypothetical protein [Thiothrix sp.]